MDGTPAALLAFVLAKVHSAATLGIRAYRVEVEVDFAGGLPAYHLVGLPAAAVHEGRYRIRAALLNAGFTLKAAKVTINLAPADVRKDGASFDLPIALGILAATEQIPRESLARRLFLGELALDGSLRSVRGVLPIAAFAAMQRFDELIVPFANGAEAAVVEKIPVRSARHLIEVIQHLRGEAELPPVDPASSAEPPPSEGALDYLEVRGQPIATRALEIAAAGSHNILLVGPPGSGKTMLAQRVTTILPTMTREEALECTTLYSVAGLLQGTGLVRQRPFRAPHHTISQAGLCGGGNPIRPGEVSLAHNGVLFLDELLEFPRICLESLRQPMEDKRIRISRSHHSVDFPAAFMLVAAMNPCPCGYWGDTERTCRCSMERIERYRSRLSGPLLDRFDMHVWVKGTSYGALRAQPEGESSQTIRDRVEVARQRQQGRFSGVPRIHANAQMTARLLRRHCTLDEEGHELLAAYSARTQASTRAIERIVRVARTVADARGDDAITPSDLLQAMSYRYLDEIPAMELEGSYAGACAAEQATARPFHFQSQPTRSVR